MYSPGGRTKQLAPPQSQPYMSASTKSNSSGQYKSVSGGGMASSTPESTEGPINGVGLQEFLSQFSSASPTSKPNSGTGGSRGNEAMIRRLKSSGGAKNGV